MNPNVDLSRLAVDREPRPLPRRRRLLARYVLPALLLIGFAALLGHAARESLFPPRPVTVLSVISVRTGIGRPVDTPLFRAAGWVEPRPTPIVVTALAEGVVEELYFVEGQAVRQGEVVARLITADAKLALANAEAELELREGALAAARAALEAAQTRFAEPLHLQADLAGAEAALARVETERGTLPQRLRSAQARLRFARQDLDNKQGAPGTVSAGSLDRARSELDAAEATVDELLARQQLLPAEVSALRARREALRRNLERKTEEARQVAEAQAAVQQADARRKQGLVLCDAARLRLDRMVVRAPVPGRVLALVARPGTRLMGLDANGLLDASMVMTLYDPSQLQARVDVRLDDVGKVSPGQEVRIETAALPGQTLCGTVLTTTSQADIQKNTLSVKVAIADPPSTLKPDMLCQVTFLAPPQSSGKPGVDSDPYRLLIPRQLVETLDGTNRVWLVDLPAGAARRRSVTLGVAAGELVEVVSGLGSTDRLIVDGREGLEDGDRVRVVGEDQTLGIDVATGESP